MRKELRTPVIAGNWKMNNDRKATVTLIEELKPLVKDATCEVVVCVPFTDLEKAVEATAGSNIKVGAQNVHWEKNGAFTGEISTGMLKELGVPYVIIGHSERRQYFGETNETVNKRTKAALAADLKVLLCVGELLEEREAGITNEICSLQTKIALTDISKEDLKNVVIAYEPVWTIGTGKTATADQAAEVCGYIRSVIADIYDDEAASHIVIQYGGSMKPDNAAELLGKEDVDGGLIGGASLVATDFAGVVNAAK